MSFECPGDDKRCDHCNRPGLPYEYKGRIFSGLTANRGDRVCPWCLDIALKAEMDEPVGWAQVPAREYVVPRAERR